MSTATREIHLVRRPVGRPTTDDFRTVEVELPDPGPGQVLVRVDAAGVNFPDLLIVQKKYQRLAGFIMNRARATVARDPQSFAVAQRLAVRPRGLAGRPLPFTPR